MLNPSLEQEILSQLHDLAPTQQQQVLAFVRALAAKPLSGVPGRELLRFTGTIELDDLQTMAQAIEEECEKVNDSEW